MDRLQGKVAVITGAGSGIGAASAKLFCQEGAKVVAIDVSGKEKEVARDIGTACTAFHADVSKSADVQAMLAHAVSAFGRLDILFNNAGIGGARAPTADYPEDEFDRVMAIDCRSVFLGMKYAIPLMLKSGGGSIVNTSSMGGLIAFPEHSGYSAAKAAVLMLTKTTAAEYAQQNIRVNALCPGPVKTAMTADIRPEVRTRFLESLPMRRMAEPEEIAALALCLASSESSYVTGTHVTIDGGYTAL